LVYCECGETFLKQPSLSSRVQAFPPFSLLEGLPQGPAGVKVVEVCVWGAGLVALLSDWRVVRATFLGKT
jgi:hypothetical protein